MLFFNNYIIILENNPPSKGCKPCEEDCTHVIKMHKFLTMYFYYNILRPKKHFKNEKRSKDAAAKKRPNTSGVGKINNYYEDIYIPPYNNTD